MLSILTKPIGVCVPLLPNCNKVGSSVPALLSLPEASHGLAETRALASRRLELLGSINAGVLNISCYEDRPAAGPAVMLLQGFPYDIYSYADVAPQLVAKGCRVIVPYLRGHGRNAEVQ